MGLDFPWRNIDAFTLDGRIDASRFCLKKDPYV